MSKKETCVICGEKIEGWGNNPWPIKEHGECCDKCNNEKVIPARIDQLLHSQRQGLPYSGFVTIILVLIKEIKIWQI